MGDFCHPNIKKLKRAQELVSEGKLDEARAILVTALITAPNSPVTRQLRDLLGDVNTEIFFSKEPSPRKTEYTVKRGDAISSIARKLESSAEAIMRVNDLDSTLIRPGEKLFVPRLDFTITIDLPRNRVVVTTVAGFSLNTQWFQPICRGRHESTIHTKVAAKSFWEKASWWPSHGLQKEITPRIDLRRAGYVLSGVEENSDTSSSEIAVENNDSEAASDSGDANRLLPGIAMLKEDIAEVGLLIRKGTPVTIILDRKQ